MGDSMSPRHVRGGQPAGAGSIAFLIVLTVLLVVLTAALWVTYFG